MVSLRCCIFSLFVLVCLVLVGESYAQEGFTELYDWNFPNIVGTGEDEPWFVLFYGARCKRCKKFYPTLDETIASVGTDGFSLGKYECTLGKVHARQFGIMHYPTMFMIHKGVGYKLEKRDQLESFLRGEWKNSETTITLDPMDPIPIHTRAISTVKHVLQPQLRHLWKFKKALMGVTFGASALVGLFIAKLTS